MPTFLFFPSFSRNLFVLHIKWSTRLLNWTAFHSTNTWQSKYFGFKCLCLAVACSLKQASSFFLFSSERKNFFRHGYGR